mmetsp:Transcript_21789/g.74897  ORF Transcript_21789/g.74897 Transcript_21789/m.74897 type:complete len:347 (+) Transcript_21789:385-1425(+)
MLKNIPNRCGQDALASWLNTSGFEGLYDMLYMPLDKVSGSNLGYAFINFEGSAACSKFLHTFHGAKAKKYFPEMKSSKVLQVAIAREQGRAPYLGRLHVVLFGDALPNDEDMSVEVPKFAGLRADAPDFVSTRAAAEAWRLRMELFVWMPFMAEYMSWSTSAAPGMWTRPSDDEVAKCNDGNGWQASAAAPPAGEPPSLAAPAPPAPAAGGPVAAPLHSEETMAHDEYNEPSHLQAAVGCVADSASDTATTAAPAAVNAADMAMTLQALLSEKTHEHKPRRRSSIALVFNVCFLFLMVLLAWVLFWARCPRRSAVMPAYHHTFPAVATTRTYPIMKGCGFSDDCGA